MSATTVSAISALLGVALQAFQSYEQIRQRALESGEVTPEDFAAQDRLLEDQGQRLKDLVSPPKP